MQRRIPALLAVAALAVPLGACGGDGAGTADGGDRASDLRRAALDYARCMRSHGVDMPDPKTDENGVMIAGEGDGPGSGTGRPDPRLGAADEKCRKHLDAAGPPKLSPEQEQDFRRRALAHARCMREHGVDFPDPSFSEDGGAVVDLSPGSGIDPQSPAFRRAQEACRKLEGGPAAAPAGGGS